MRGPYKTEPLAQRLDRFSIPEPMSGCLLWMGATDRKGYGLLTVRSRMKQAHRASYEVAKGPIPPGLHVLHSCDNPSCIAPGHLRAGTRSENVAEAWARGRRRPKVITHCKRGHEFTQANTRIGSKGERVCRACHALMARIRAARSRGLG
jgi:hypothetical protein